MIKKFGMIAVILCLLSGCGETDASQNNSQDEKLTIAFPWSPPGLDPHESGRNSWDVMRSGAGETLIKLDEQLQPTSWLAKSWIQEDETTWIFELQENVIFHNGSQMTASNVKDSLLRSVQLNSRANDLLLLQSIEAVDNNKLTITTSQPNSALISHLADPSFIIVDTATIEDDKYPALTGAFAFKEFKKDEFLVVERFEDYWGEVAQLSEVTMKFISDGNTRLMSLQSGEADIAIDIPVDGTALIDQNEQLKVVTAPSMRTHLVLYNMNSPLLHNVTFRQSIDQIIPREEIVETVMNGFGTAANSAFPDILSFGHIQSTTSNHTIDDTMTEAGWEKNALGIWEKEDSLFELKMLTFPQRPELSIMAEIIQHELESEGFKLQIRQVESIDDALAQDDWDLSMYSMLTAHTGDPQYFLNIFYRENSSSNMSHYASKPLEALVDQLNQTTDTDKRTQLAIEAQEIIHRDVPQSFIVHPETIFGMKNEVQGFIAHPIEYYYINPNIYIQSH
jgi:peptide/nickel transport system substrate-binding protein